MQDSFKLDEERLNTPFSPSLLSQIRSARHRRHVNKQTERLREKRGEVLRRTIKRRNKGPPAHVLALMTPEERKMDKVVRSVSEVGFVGMMKRRMGFKLRDGESWKKEFGWSSEEERTRLDKLDEVIRRENVERRIRRAKEGDEG